MAYAIADVEATEPLPGLALAPGEEGVLVLVRVRGRPVHRAMHALPAGARLSPDDVSRLLGRSAVQALVEEAVRAELASPAEARPVSLTVAVCTHARPELLEACLARLLAVRPGEGDARRFDVLVVDNNPPDDATERVVRSLPDVRYAREPRRGLDIARNRALAESRGTWTAFLDDDVVVDHGWLEGLEEAVAEHPEAVSVTGLVLPSELRTPAQVAFEQRGGFGRGCRKLRFAGPAGPDNPLYPLGSGIFGAGCNMVLRTGAVTALGGFDEALDTGPPLPGGGDLDIWSRLARAGHVLVYEPRLLVFHRHRPDHASLRRQYWSWGEGFMAYLAKTARVAPQERRKAVRLAAWWTQYEVRQVASSVGRSGAAAFPDLAVAELLGGLAGAAGGYGRSRRRIARLAAARG